MKILRGGVRPLSIVLLLVLLSGAAVLAQQAAVFYVYDELNRLGGVVDQQGNAATYTYDAVGNILRIDRFDTAGIPGPIGITLVSPSKGKVGTAVQIFGKGFSVNTAQNAVAFNGTPATVTAASPNRLVTSVPGGAISGPVTVTAPSGSAVSSTPFRVLGTIAVWPTSATVVVTHTQQFQAQEAGVATTNVRWTVNDLPDGDSTVGTITADGLYTAPAAVPVSPTVTVTAIHKDDQSLTASAAVTIQPPQPIFVAAALVSFGFPATPTTVNRNVASIVSIARAPVITAVTPAAGARGATVTVTLTGGGFAGTTTVQVLLNNAVDSAITTSNIVTSGDGTQLSADLSISAAAAIGARVVQVTTPPATSTAVATDGNVFSVQ